MLTERAYLCRVWAELPCLAVGRARLQREKEGKVSHARLPREQWESWPLKLHTGSCGMQEHSVLTHKAQALNLSSQMLLISSVGDSRVMSVASPCFSLGNQVIDWPKSLSRVPKQC